MDIDATVHAIQRGWQEEERLRSVLPRAGLPRITGSALTIMRDLWRMGGEAPALKEVRGGAGTNSAYSVRTLKNLGFVEDEIADDRRIKRLRLTKRGADFMLQLQRVEQ